MMMLPHTAILIVLLTPMPILVSSMPYESEDWDYFVFAQQWPQAVCLPTVGNNFDHPCTIPENVTTWVVHGLWPSKKGQRKPGPSFCGGKSAKFDLDEIKDIEDQLKEYWPNLYTDEPLDSFWQHEWLKHGTCATTLPATRGEKNYFNMGLQLNNKQFDLIGIFQLAGYKPSDTSLHKVRDLYDALNVTLHGKPYLECVEDKDTNKVFLGQVEVCTDKTFHVIDCEHTNHQYNPEVLYFQSLHSIKGGHSANLRPCRLEEMVLWPVIKHI